MIVLPQTDPENAFTIASELCRLIESTPIDIGQAQLDVTASIGVSGVNASSLVRSSRALFKAADSALYKAKKSGRNCVVSGAVVVGGSD